MSCFGGTNEEIILNIDGRLNGLRDLALQQHQRVNVFQQKLDAVLKAQTAAESRIQSLEVFEAHLSKNVLATPEYGPEDRGDPAEQGVAGALQGPGMYSWESQAAAADREPLTRSVSSPLGGGRRKSKKRKTKRKSR